MPNFIAYFALIAWPIVSLIFYSKLKPLYATLGALMGGFLVLPMKTEFDFPLVPPLNKGSIASISALLGYICIAKLKYSVIPRSGWERWLVCIMLFGPIVTILNNQEPIGVSAGLTYYDTVSAIIAQYLEIMPFLLGLCLIKTYDDQVKLFKWLLIAGLIYSLPALIEVRLSPQFHTWIYGFFPHSFLQQMRAGGFRPVVFLGHGLTLAKFFSICLGCGVILWREKIGVFHKYNSKASFFVIAYLFVLLLLCKTAIAIIFGATFILVMGMMPQRIIKGLAILFILIVILYPLLSMLNLFPHQGLVDIAGSFSSNRAQSLDFRFSNEVRLLEFAQQKLLFGWGLWGRNMVPGSITDGYWIVVLGRFGMVGFVAVFGLAALSIFRGIKAGQLLDLKSERNLIYSHALLVSIVMIDQIVNASLDTWLWFIIGGLLGRANYIFNENINSKRLQTVMV